MKPLSKLQSEAVLEKQLGFNDFKVYKWLCYMKDKGIVMSLKDMCKILEFKSMTSLQRSLYKLEELELVNRDKYQQFSWKVTKKVTLICPCCRQIINL